MVELEDFKYSGTNITAFRMIDPGREEVTEVVEDYIRASEGGGGRFGAVGRKLPYPLGQTLRVRGAAESPLRSRYDVANLAVAEQTPLPLTINRLLNRSLKDISYFKNAARGPHFHPRAETNDKFVDKLPLCSNRKGLLNPANYIVRN